MDGFGLFGMTGEEIYRNFTEATGAGDLAAASELWKELQEEHEEEARRVRALAVRMESAWQGDAAGAAQRGAIPLAVEHESSAPLLFTDHDLFGRQVGSFNDARNQVVPVPPTPDQPSGFEILFSPQALPTYERKLAEYNEAAQRNVDVMDGYEGASSYNGANLPNSYGSLEPDSAGISVAPDSGEDPGHPKDAGPRTDDGHRPPVEGNWLPHPASSGPQPGGSDGGPSAGPSGASPGASGGSPSQNTTPGGVVPPPSEVPWPRPGLPGSGPGVPSGGGQSQIGGLVPVGGWSGGGGMPGGPGAGGSPGGGGSGGRLRAEPGGGRPGGESGHGPGGRAGSGPVAGGTTAEAAARGAAGARGGGGAGLPMGVGAGRGRGAEDIERRAPDYLEEPDPEGMFGADMQTAPPVIGAEQEEPA